MITPVTTNINNGNSKQYADKYSNRPYTLEHIQNTTSYKVNPLSHGYRVPLSFTGLREVLIRVQPSDPLKRQC